MTCDSFLLSYYPIIIIILSYYYYYYYNMSLVLFYTRETEAVSSDSSSKSCQLEAKRMIYFVALAYHVLLFKRTFCH